MRLRRSRHRIIGTLPFRRARDYRRGGGDVEAVTAPSEARAELAVRRRLPVELDDELVEALAGQQDFLLRHGYIEQAFEVRDWIEARPLENAREITAPVGA